MSALIASRRQGRSATAAFFERFASRVRRYARALSQRQALRKLARLDDRMLKDIGLFRGDIDAAESLPLGNDPIALLQSLRAGRNRARFELRYY